MNPLGQLTSLASKAVSLAPAAAKLATLATPEGLALNVGVSLLGDTIKSEVLKAAPRLSDLLAPALNKSPLLRPGLFDGIKLHLKDLIAAGGPPILGDFQAQRATDKYNALSPSDKCAFNCLLGQCKSQDERDYLRKALAAGNSMSDISWFAGQIRGKSRSWMAENLRLVDDTGINGYNGIKQQWNDSCGPTTAQAIKGEMDPIYSLRVHQGNQDIHNVDPTTNIFEKVWGWITGKPQSNAGIADEQKAILEKNGGVAVERGQTGGKGMSLPPALNEFSAATGVTYQARYCGNATDRSAAITKMNQDLARGIPCALRISSSTTASGGHFVAVTGIKDGPPKMYTIHDPWEGKTVMVKASDLEAGNIIPSIAGWTTLTHVYTS